MNEARGHKITVQPKGTKLDAMLQGTKVTKELTKGTQGQGAGETPDPVTYNLLENEIALIPLNDHKKPIIKWHSAPETFGGIRDLNALRQYQARGVTAFGIATGEHGLVVLDCDTDKKTGENAGERDLRAILGDDFEAIRDTYTVTTPSGGRHYYFTVPDEDCNKYKTEVRIVCDTGKGPRHTMIDVRASGGYAVAPYSKTHKGTYLPDLGKNAMPLPECVARFLHQRDEVRQEYSAVVPTCLGEATPTQQMYLEILIGAICRSPVGERNTTLSKSAGQAFRMTPHYFLPGYVQDRLRQAGTMAGLKLGEINATIESARRWAQGQAPRIVN